MSTPRGECHESFVKPHPAGSEILIQVQPRAKRTGIVGVHGGRLKVSVSSPPVAGKANERLCRLLARTLRVSKSDIVLIGGASSRAKRVVIRGIHPDAAASRLAINC